jgi:hypothetical protein
LNGLDCFGCFICYNALLVKSQTATPVLLNSKHQFSEPGAAIPDLTAGAMISGAGIRAMLSSAI